MSGYLNFGETVGEQGYGIRDNAGAMEFKNQSGNWSSLNTIIQNYLTLNNYVPAGTTAGWCAQGWGGVNQNGTPVPPAYFDQTVNGSSQFGPTHVGCSCQSGWQLVTTGTCNFGDCALTPTGQVFMEMCVKK